MRKYSGGDDFSDANTIIAQFAFLILILIIFIFAIYLGVAFLSYLMQPRSTVYLVYGMANGSAGLTINQDPTDANAITIWRSNNRDKGIEFTWGIWVIINDLASAVTAQQGVWQNIFNKGGNGTYHNGSISGSAYPNTIPGASINNAPGIYLNPKTNTLRIMMDIIGNNTTQVGPSYIDIDNIPFKKWFHIAIRLENTLLDVYINGVISGRIQLPNVPDQNYDNVYICYNGGFNGNISNLMYMTFAANVYQIQNIVNQGPNTTSYSDTSIYSTNDYLSTAWYAAKF